MLQLGQSSDGHSSNQKIIDGLGNVKDAIGEWHDWEELAAIAKDVLDHAGCKLLSKLRSISDSKYQEAAKLTENLRKKYLGTSPRKKSRKKQQLEIGRPVLASTLTLASSANRQAA